MGGSFFPGIGNYNIHITIKSRDTPTHAHSRSFKNPPGCLDRRENITRRGWRDNRETRRSTKQAVIADSVSWTMTGIFDRDRESREHRSNAGQRMHNRGKAGLQELRAR